MKCLPLLFLIFFSYTGHTQYVPDSVTYTPGRFAEYLKNAYPNPNDQVKTLYHWITGNIQYDKDSAMFFNWSADNDTKINATLRRRKGVCENYASLLKDIAGRLDIPAFVVHGYPSYANKNKDNSHSWVALQQNNEWYLFDPTWDAQGNTEKYYQVSPADFMQTHIPFDPLWQLLEKPVNYKITGNSFAYKDSVHAFLQLDSLQQFLATERRIKHSEDQNTTTKNFERFNRMNVAVIAGEQDMNLYNAAVEALNKANKTFNAFVQYRNQQFTPSKTDTEIKRMLSPVKPLLDDARTSIKNMGKLTDNFQYDPSTISERIAALEKKLEVQMLFVKKYLETAPAERVKLFYK